MRKYFFGLIFVITFMLVPCIESNAINNSLVKITTKNPIVNQKMEFEVEGVNEYTYKWYVNDTEISSSLQYIPTEDDLEKWIGVRVYDADNVLIGEDYIYFSRLPVLYIETDDGEVITSKTTYKTANLSIQGNEEYNQQYDGEIVVKVRGNSSSYYPQRPYKIKLDKKTDLFGLGKNKHWVLISSYMDQCALRNKLGSELAKELNLAKMDMVWVDVVINGSYVGLYTLSEHIRIDENRINIFNWENEAEIIAKSIYASNKDVMDASDRDAIEDILCEDLGWVSSGTVDYNGITYIISDYYTVSSDISGGYLFEMSNEYDEVSKFTTDNEIKVMLNSPEYLYTNDAMMDYVKRYWQDYEDAISSINGYNDENVYYGELANFDSMIEYWLVMEILGNNDAYYKSRYAYKDQEGKLIFGPVWDFDWGCGSYTVGVNSTGWKLSTGTLWKDFIDDPYFQIKASEKYWLIREKIDDIIKDGGWIDKNIFYLNEAGNANDICYPAEKYGSSSRRTFKTDAEMFKTYLADRIAWLDTQFETQNSTTSSMYLSASTHPYVKSETQLGITLLNAETDNASEHLKADGLLNKGDDLQLCVSVADNDTKEIEFYVNGLFQKKCDILDGLCNTELISQTLDEKKGSRNVVSIIGYDGNGEVTYTNYATVIIIDAELTAGTPYSLDEDGGLLYDVTVPHIIINQVYGGKKKDSYASNSFVELYNPTDNNVDLSGWSLQYRSSVDGGDNESWSKLNLTGTILSHCSYLIKCASIKNPVEGSISIDNYDQYWNQVINNKGCSILLVANNTTIESDSAVFDNNTGKPVVSGYVDMIGVSGNDTENETQIADEAALFYEKEASRVQSKKIGIRRKRIEDTDDNSVEGDFEEVDYSFDNAEYRNYIKPKCSLDGVWIFNESEIPHYTVSFVKFAGGGITQSEYVYTSKVEKPNDPERIGYTFTGWYEDAGCTVPYNFKTKPTSDITLYAGWNINTYIINYETNGGSTVDDDAYNYGVQTSIPIEPEKDGYTFAGWYLDEELTELFSFGKMPAENITLYAKWNVDSYIIRFVTNGGSAVEEITKEYGSEVSAPAEPVKEGYTFNGWYSDRKLESRYEFATMPAKNITLYVGWKAEEHTISFNSNGGSTVENITKEYGNEISMPTEPTKEGFVFAGWYSDKELTNVYEFTTMPADDITLYAKWNVDSYTIRFVTNGGSAVEEITKEYGSEVSAPAEPVKEGYTFNGWYSDRKLENGYEFATMPAKNITLYAGWNPVVNTVSFNTDGGNKIDDTEIVYGDASSIETPSKEGYTFNGWYVDKECTIPYNPDKVYADNNITLYADWKIKEYTVKWIDYDGTVLKTEKVAYKKNGTAPKAPNREGYEFIGWSNTADNLTSNLTIEAEYDKVSILLSVKYAESLNNDKVYNVQKNKTSVAALTLYTKKYNKAYFSAKVIGTSNIVKWSSSDSSIATVTSEGIVVAKKAGVTYITAETNGEYTRCKITVKSAAITAKLAGKKVKNKRITLKKGKKYKLKVSVLPYGKVKFKSKNKKTASVSSKGKITAKKKGKTTIIITANGMKKKVKVRVK